MVVHPSFNSIAKAGFNFLLNDFGCKIDIKKETWLLSVTFENEKLKVSIELSDKDFYFNVLVTLNNQLSCVPLWAICKIEKLDTGLLTGSIINQGSLETMCNNSGEALSMLLPRILQYSRAERRKIENVLQKQVQATLNK